MLLIKRLSIQVFSNASTYKNEFEQLLFQSLKTNGYKVIERETALDLTKMYYMELFGGTSRESVRITIEKIIEDNEYINKKMERAPYLQSIMLSLCALNENACK